MSSKCLGCGHRTSATAGYCQSCKSKRFHARKRIKEEGLIVEQAGGSWWIWDKKGDVLVMGQPTKAAAVNALAFGQEEDDYDGAQSSVHHATKKSPAQLDREIYEALEKPKFLARLSHEDGTRNHLGKLLATVARSEPSGLAASRTAEIGALVRAGYITYGLHPMGGHRANITSLGRDALANI